MVPRGARPLVACLVVSFAAGCTVPTRVATLERDNARLREQVTALQSRVDRLDDKVAALGKRLGPANGKGARRSIEQRLGSVEQGRDEAEAARAAESPAPRPPSPPAPLPELDREGLRRDLARDLPTGYRRGLDRLQAGAYEDAIRALRDFARAKHDSPFAAGAHYWIGQAYMQLAQFYQAILAFTEVQQRASATPWAASAGIASGTAFLELGNVSEARRAFEKVIADAPTTPEAAVARARIGELDRAAR